MADINLSGNSTRLDEARLRHLEAIEKMEEWNDKYESLPENASPEEREFFANAFDAACAETKRWAERVEREEAILEARRQIRANEADEQAGQETTKGEASGETRQPIHVKEALVYQRGGKISFFQDVFDSRAGNEEAHKRLAKHRAQMAVEKRDLAIGTNTGAEFIPPLYLLDRWADVARPARPFANAVPNMALPEGVDVIKLPRLTTSPAVAIQASENSAVQETDPATDEVTANVETIAGQVDLSRQLFERSRVPIDEWIFRSLGRDYATKLDVQLLAGSGTSQQHRGIGNVTSRIAVTYTDTTPTLPELRSKIADAIQQINTNLYLPPDLILMHPRRWGWCLAQNDSSNRPLIDADTAPMNSAARFDRVAAENLVGQMLGLPVLVDASLTTTAGAGTNEDYIFVLRTDEMMLFEEGAPRQRIFEDVGSGTLTVRLQVYGYSAFLATVYPKAIAQISGTGLTAPTF